MAAILVSAKLYQINTSNQFVVISSVFPSTILLQIFKFKIMSAKDKVNTFISDQQQSTKHTLIFAASLTFATI